ncbi:GTPase Era [Candidatus Mycoplasma mahonii]|uniref:GTPase Era n=1 Tax=Candidatus Mycoplasma mahonii TaxID=3004105 RepID=UPI0026ECC3C0|nr:GTPase Era [Candidatus Mycoplasma mahonii]WKX02789.1 GTPase Era [Candidatus Mycoplasma mahonii]
MKVGFVTIVGRPNVGKSSLLNHILDYKVAITSDKPQTTRDQIKGIYNDDDSQIVFIDTPGIHKPKQKLGESLNVSAYKSLKDIELVLFLQPANELIGPGDRKIIEKISNYRCAAVITKIDVSNQEEVVEKVNELKVLGFKDVLATSIEINESIDSLINFIKENLEVGSPYYDQEQITDCSMKFIAKEAIRESAINLMKDEIPHSLGVVIDDFDETKLENRYFISATIYVERDSQKGILIGKDGSMIKKIGTSARRKISYSFDKKIVLDLRVKVSKNWTSKVEEIIKMGY